MSRALETNGGKKMSKLKEKVCVEFDNIGDRFTNERIIKIIQFLIEDILVNALKNQELDIKSVTFTFEGD